MATLSAGLRTTFRFQIGTILTLALGAGASVRVTEITTAGVPLTPVAYTLTPLSLGPFKTLKDVLLEAVNGTVTYTDDVVDPLNAPLRCLDQSAVALVAPANTAENILVTTVIPGGIMGINGMLEVVTLWSMTNGINVKTYRVRLNGIAGTIYQTIVGTSLAQFITKVKILNRGSLASQVGADPALNGYGSSAAALVTSTINMAVDVPLVITAQKATGGDTVTLEAYSVNLYSHFT